VQWVKGKGRRLVIAGGAEEETGIPYSTKGWQQLEG